MAYGIVPAGFVKKPLPVILSEIEQTNITLFGAGVVQDAQSPLGRLNIAEADALAALWETAEMLYSSNDIFGADGFRLDQLAAIRGSGLLRAVGESDEDFLARIINADALTNTGRGLLDAVMAVPGVSWATVTINATPVTSPAGLPAFTTAVAVVGGADAAIAAAIYANTHTDVALYGNTVVDIGVPTLGISFIRTTDLSLVVDAHYSTPPGLSVSAASIEASILAALINTNNGVTLGPRSLDVVFGGIDASIECLLYDTTGSTPRTDIAGIPLDRRPVLVAGNVRSRVVAPASGCTIALADISAVSLVAATLSIENGIFDEVTL